MTPVKPFLCKTVLFFLQPAADKGKRYSCFDGYEEAGRTDG